MTLGYGCAVMKPFWVGDMCLVVTMLFSYVHTGLMATRIGASTAASNFGGAMLVVVKPRNAPSMALKHGFA
jgi:hypothetical protein